MSPTTTCASILVLLGLGASLPISAADAVVWRTDYAAARKEATEKKLPILIIVSSENCFYCRKMEGNTFSDPLVAAQIAASYIPLKIDANKSPDFTKALRVTVYPTTVLATSSGDIVGFLQGFIAAEQYREHLGKVLAIVKAREPAVPEVPAVVATKPVVVATPVAIVKAPRAFIAQQLKANDLLAAARSELKADRLNECLEHCEELLAVHANSPEASEALALTKQIKSNPDMLRAAEQQMDERNAKAYISLGDAWVESKRYQDAATCYEKAVRLQTASATSSTAKMKLANLLSEHPVASNEKR